MLAVFLAVGLAVIATTIVIFPNIPIGPSKGLPEPVWWTLWTVGALAACVQGPNKISGRIGWLLVITGVAGWLFAR